MTEKQAISHQRIIDCLWNDYGIKVTSLLPLLLGADTNALIFKAQVDGQPSYFVKLKQGHDHELSASLLASLHDAGIEEIIPPIKTASGQVTKPIDGFTLIVYPFVEGQNGFSHHLTDNQWVTLGKVLRQVHQFDPPAAIKKQLKRESYSPNWRDVVRSLIEAQPAGDSIALKLSAVMKRHKTAIDRLVDGAEQLAQVVQKQSPKFVLCHSDIHAGNVLLDGGGGIYIVDWDEPIMAPKERDLMFIGGGVANVWNHPHEEELFYRGYGTTEVNKSILAYYRHERIVEDIAIYGEALLLTAGGGEEGRSEMYNHFIAMFEPRGVVEIAFKTL